MNRLWFPVCLVSLLGPELLDASSVVDLTLGGTGGSYAAYINDSGDVTGYAYISGNSVYHTFLYASNSLTDLDAGTAYSGFSSHPLGLSDNGYVSGTVFTGSGPSAFLYNGTLSALGALPGGSISFGFGVNDSGSVVGNSSNGTSQTPAFYWNGAMNNLGTIGGSSATAQFINDNGQISGNSNTSGDHSTEAFYAASGSSTPTAITLGGTASTATAMNSSGQVAGTSALSAGTIQQAFLYTPGTTPTTDDIGTQWVGTDSYYGNSVAYAINDSGVAAGQADVASGEYHAVMFAENTFANYVMTDLGTLDNNLGNSTADAISSNGWIVGTSANTTGGTDPFLYMDGQMLDLNTAQFLTGSGFTSFLTATGVNDLGQIVGQGMTASGVKDAYLLNYYGTAAVPEPSTLLSISSGLLLCGVCARRVRARVTK